MSDNRIVRNAEAESIASAEQRRSEEQKWINEQERAGAARKRYKKMWDKISQMFLLGSPSGIAVLGDVIREYLLVNLIVLFGFVNMGIILIRIYLRKKFDCM